MRQFLFREVMAAVVAVGLCAPLSVYARDGEVVYAEVTEDDDLYLTLLALEQAVASPTSFNLAQLAPALGMDSIDSLSSLIEQIHQAVLATGPESTDRTVHLSIETICRSGDTASVQFRCQLQVGPVLNQRSFIARVVRGRLCLQVADPSQLLYKLKGFAEEVQAKRIDIPPERAVGRSPVSLGSNTSDLVSNKLLIPNTLYEGYTRFTSTVSRSEFDGNIFSRPYGVAAVVYDDPWNWLDHNFLFVTDPNWNRIIGSSRNPYRSDELHWLQAVGGYGTGNMQFNHPVAVAFTDQRWFVADGYNNRVQAYHLDWENGNLTHQYTLSNSFDYVADVAAARIPSLVNPAQDVVQVAVLDQGHNRLVIYDYYGSYQRTINIPGERPTSVCYVRDYRTHYPMGYVYVLCDGNDRVVRLNTLGTDPNTSYSKQNLFPADAYLSSIAVDAYNTIYVLDSRHSKIYVLSWDLQEILATFGTNGTADNQLNWPNKLEIAEGWRYVPDTARNSPMIIGDAVVTEFFGAESGLRRFKLGCEVLWDSVKYIPYVAGYSDWVRCQWLQSNTSERWVTLRCQGQLIDSSYEPVNVAGQQYRQIPLAENAPTNAWYKFKVRVRSKYGTTDTTFVDSIYVIRHEDSGPRIIVEDKGFFDPSGEFEPWCLHPDGSRWWCAYISAYDNHFDSQLTYWWLSPHQLHSDTDDATIDPWHTMEGPFQFITAQDTAWFKVTTASTGLPNGALTNVFSVFISTQPFNPEWRYNDYTWCDTVRQQHYLYWNACSTPCRPPCVVNYGCPMLYAWNGGDFAFVDNVLPASEQGGGTAKDVEDSYPVHGARPDDDGLYRFVISETEEEVSYFDRCALTLCQIPDDHGQVVVPEGSHTPVRLTSGGPIAPVKATSSEGEDVLPLLSRQDSSFYTSDLPGYVDAEYELSEGDEILLISQPPIKGIPKPAPDETAPTDVITVYAMRSDGTWVHCQKLYPRVNSEVSMLDLSDHIHGGRLAVRLAWSRSISLDWLPYRAFERIDCDPVDVELVDANHSKLGSVRSMLDAVDNQKVTLQPGERIELSFRAPEVADGSSNLLLFNLVGHYEKATSMAEKFKTAFAFAQNYPNPFNPSTCFNFSLPVSAPVTLKIYDILGREVTTVVDREYAAGSHSIVWDGTDANGQHLASGIFFAKIVAGEYTSTRKVVVVK